MEARRAPRPEFLGRAPGRARRLVLGLARLFPPAGATPARGAETEPEPAQPASASEPATARVPALVDEAPPAVVEIRAEAVVEADEAAASPPPATSGLAQPAPAGKPTPVAVIAPAPSPARLEPAQPAAAPAPASEEQPPPASKSGGGVAVGDRTVTLFELRTRRRTLREALDGVTRQLVGGSPPARPTLRPVRASPRRQIAAVRDGRRRLLRLLARFHCAASPLPRQPSPGGRGLLEAAGSGARRAFTHQRALDSHTQSDIQAERRRRAEPSSSPRCDPNRGPAGRGRPGGGASAAPASTLCSSGERAAVALHQAPYVAALERPG